MAMWGVGSPSFMGTGTPDYNMNTLAYATLDPEWNDPRVIEHQSVITGKKTWTTLGDYASFRVSLNLYKYTTSPTPSEKFATLMTYLHKLVIFLPHAHGVTIGDYKGLPISISKAAITGATNANPCVITAPSHGFSNGDLIFISNVSGMTQINDIPAFVTYINANSFSIDYDETSASTYTSGGIASKVVRFFVSKITPYYLSNTVLKDIVDIEFIAEDYVDITKNLQ